METVSEQSVNHDERRQAAKGAGDEMTAAGKAEGKAARKAARKTGGSGKSGAKAKPGERYERGTRSYTMSHIRGKDTRIEVLVRRYLFSRGLRFRKNDRRYPGHPGVVLPKWHTIVFINGCFWHAHQGCSKYSIPKSNVEFWTAKLTRNHDRDIAQHAALESAGWHVIVVWECELAKPVREARLERLYTEITVPGSMASNELADLANAAGSVNAGGSIV